MLQLGEVSRVSQCTPIEGSIKHFRNLAYKTSHFALRTDSHDLKLFAFEVKSISFCCGSVISFRSAWARNTRRYIYLVYARIFIFKYLPIYRLTNVANISLDNSTFNIHTNEKKSSRKGRGVRLKFGIAPAEKNEHPARARTKRGKSRLAIWRAPSSYPPTHPRQGDWTWMPRTEKKSRQRNRNDTECLTRSHAGGRGRICKGLPKGSKQGVQIWTRARLLCKLER